MLAKGKTRGLCLSVFNNRLVAPLFRETLPRFVFEVERCQQSAPDRRSDAGHNGDRRTLRRGRCGDRSADHASCSEEVVRDRVAQRKASLLLALAFGAFPDSAAAFA